MKTRTIRTISNWIVIINDANTQNPNEFIYSLQFNSILGCRVHVALLSFMDFTIDHKCICCHSICAATSMSQFDARNTIDTIDAIDTIEMFEFFGSMKCVHTQLCLWNSNIVHNRTSLLSKRTLSMFNDVHRDDDEDDESCIILNYTTSPMLINFSFPFNALGSRSSNDSGGGGGGKKK